MLEEAGIAATDRSDRRRHCRLRHHPATDFRVHDSRKGRNRIRADAHVLVAHAPDIIALVSGFAFQGSCVGREEDTS